MSRRRIRKFSTSKERTDKLNSPGNRNISAQACPDAFFTEIQVNPQFARRAGNIAYSFGPGFSLPKTTRFLTLILLLVFISMGCNTYEGAKQDTKDAGRAIGEGAEEAGDEIEDALD